MPVPVILILYSALFAHMVTTTTQEERRDRAERAEEQREERRQEREDNAVVAKRLIQYGGQEQLEYEKEEESKREFTLLQENPTKPKDNLQQQLQQPKRPTLSPSIPNPLYCPLSNTIMTDPVVLPNGQSYERDVIVEDRQCADVAEEGDIYPNRVLTELLEMVKEKRAKAPDPTPVWVDHLDDYLQSGFHNLFSVQNKQYPQQQQQQQQQQQDDLLRDPNPAEKVSNDAVRPTRSKAAALTLPDCFYCPITAELILDPVIDPEGYTYERSAIFRWVRDNHTSPITRSPLRVSQLYDNKALHRWIILEIANCQQDEECTKENQEPKLRAKQKALHDDNEPLRPNRRSRRSRRQRAANSPLMYYHTGRRTGEL